MREGSLGGKDMHQGRNGSSQGNPDEGYERDYQSDKIEIVYGAMHREMISMLGFRMRKVLSKYQKQLLCRSLVMFL
jgi:hypothetical protein